MKETEKVFQSRLVEWDGKFLKNCQETQNTIVLFPFKTVFQ